MPKILVLAGLESETKSVLQQNMLQSQANSEVQGLVASSEGQTEQQTKLASLPDTPAADGEENSEKDLKRGEKVEPGWKVREKRAILKKYQPKPPTLELTKYANMPSSDCHHIINRGTINLVRGLFGNFYVTPNITLKSFQHFHNSCNFF